MRLRLLTAMQNGECVHIQPDAQNGVSATIITADGKQSSLPGTQILVGPLGSQASVPFKGKWSLSGGEDATTSTLQLNNPHAAQIELLSARQPGSGDDSITVSVANAM